MSQDPRPDASSSLSPQEQLLAAEAEVLRLRELGQRIPLPVFVKDPQSRYVDINQAFEEATGFQREYLLGKKTTDIAPGEIGAFHIEMDRKMAESPGPQVYESQYITADGSAHRAIFLRNPLPLVEGKYVGLVGTFLDIEDRQKVEESLRRSEERLNLILQQSRDGINIVEFDPRTARRKLLLCNDRYVEMSGYTREQLMAAEDLNRLTVPYEDKAKAREHYQKILKGEPFTGQGSWKRPDGKENYYEWTACSLRVDGKVLIVGIDRDVTERRAAEEALRRAKEDWEQTFHAVPDLIAILSNDHRILRVNEAMARRLGRRPEECVGLTCHEAVHGLSSPPDFCPHMRTLADGQEHSVEVREERLGGDFLATTTPLRDRTGKLIGAVHTARDITNAKLAEQALRDSEERYRTVVESAGETISVIDGGGKYWFMNSFGARQRGLSPAEAARKNFADFYDPPDAERGLALIREVLRTGRPFEGEIQTTHGGAPRWTYVTLRPFPVPEGVPPCVVAVARDITESKRAEETLAASERRYRSLFEALDEGLALHETICDEKGEPCDYRFLDVNPAFERLTGLRKEDLVGRKQSEVLPQEGKEWVRFFGEVALTGKAAAFEKHSVVTDKHFEGIAFSPAPGQFAGLFKDVTERRRAQDALRRSEEQYRAVVETSGDAIAVVDQAGTYRFANTEAARLFGLDVEALIGKNLRDVYPPEEAEVRRALFREVQEADGPVEKVFRMAVGGRLRWMRARFSPFPSPEGELPAILGILRDITQEKEAEEALRRSEEQYRTVVEQAGDAIVVADEDGRFLFINGPGAARHGLKPQDMIGKMFHDFYAPEDAQARIEIYRQVLREGRPIEREIRTVSNGRERWASVRFCPFPTPPGTRPHVLGIGRDVTAQKQAEEALRKSEESERYLHTKLAILHGVANELSRAPSFDDLCRLAVELGRSRLGFDRLALWFLSEDGLSLEGSYGTDEEGHTRDERGCRVSAACHPVIAEAVQRRGLVLRDDAMLGDHRSREVGRGTLAAAPLWDGERFLGCLLADNLLKKGPLTENDGEVLMLYGSMVARHCLRHRATEALRRSEELYRTLVESTEATICQYDVDGVCLFMNSNGARGLHARPEEFVGKTMWDLFPREQADYQMAVIRRVIEKGKGETVEYETLVPRGPRWFRVTVEPLRAPEGGKPRALVFARDITEAKEAADQLDAANRRLRSIVENSWDVIFEIDLKGRYTYGNPAAERMTGYPLSEIVGMSMTRLVAPEHAAAVQERLKRRMTGESLPQPFQFEIIRRDGGRVSVELVTTPVLEDGKLVRVQGIARDVTDRLRAERELRAAQERLQHLVSASPAIILSFEISDPPRIFYISPNASSLLGYAIEDLSKPSFWDRIVHPDDREAAQERLRKAMEANTNWTNEYRVLCADGSYHWLLSEFVLTAGDGNAPRQAIGHLVDITARKEAEETIRQAHRELVNAREEERKRLAAEMHDSLGQELIGLHLRMQGVAPGLLRHADRRTRQELEGILNRCQEVIQGVRNMSHMLFPPLLESVGLASALREMAGRLASPIPIKVEAGGSLERLRWPPEVEIALFRIAQEMLGNALRHSQATRIKLSLEYKHKQVILSIRDDGVGFDAGQGSAGLGLSTMRDRAETVGGKVTVESMPGSTHIEVRVPAEGKRRE